MSNPPEPLEVLSGALETRFGLERCADAAALRNRTADKPAGFVMGLKIRMGEYYDIQPAITVYDSELGTLGLVERISRTDSEATCLRAIERAAAVRQILIDAAEEASRKGVRELALQVELVLVVAGAVPESAPESLRMALTRVARETGYLRLTGLSILDADLHPDFPDAALRRAFAWLLRDTKKWYRRDVFRADGTSNAGFWREGGESLRLRLKNYRLAGEREFHCEDGSWLNLVHGHNGAGKSSLAEALELLLTDRIQRLDEGGEQNYFLVVRHRGPEAQESEIAQSSAAEIRLLDSKDAVRAAVQITFAGRRREGAAPAKAVQSNSFRIDQVFMDKLVRSLPAGRAALFLSAFSPGESERLAQLQGMRTKVRNSWADLAEHVRKRAEAELAKSSGSPTGRELNEEEMAAFVVRELGPLTEQGEDGSKKDASGTAPAALPRASLEALLPASPEDMGRLGQMHPTLKASVDALLKATDRAGLGQAAAQFQSAWTSFMGALPLLLSDLKTTRAVFQEFQPWIATGRTTRGADFESDLRQWVELQALADLTARYGEIAATVQAATSGGWKPGKEDAFLLSAKPEAQGRNATLTQQLNDARARVESWQQQEKTPAGGGMDSGKVRRWLSPREVEALNQAGQYLASASCRDLGMRFNRALASDHEASLTDMVIGRKGGLDQAMRESAEIAGVCERIQQAQAGRTGEPNALTRVTSLVQDARQLQELSKELPQSFFRKLASDPKERDELLAAFNELLALMTPARWAYRDIEITPEMAGGDPALGLATAGGARADLLFNTAELNAFAVVLFLLLAPRIANPLRLLILDDPLQNMDELTVVTLARAIAKLRPPVYPSGWQILALFHGERNVEVIREETPCVVYHLPWLPAAAGHVKTNSPAQAGDTRQAAWQKLTEELLAPV